MSTLHFACLGQGSACGLFPGLTKITIFDQRSSFNDQFVGIRRQGGKQKRPENQFSERLVDEIIQFQLLT
ncbi:hypothetical protein [Azonexus sp.]|uniref:hypothetical protein n=1 Tax=Azonexus sp. TaxID=1872668 RepID=UPI0027B9B70F|nr:hypothetical protein [Azonexus sp.]